MTMEQMEYPDGVYDFKSLVTGGYYFVDKTKLICDLCGVKNKTLLFTRPRRFGKTINLSMIDRFFNLKYADEEDIFEGLEVSECARCAPYKNAYPVVRLNFGDLSGESKEKFHASLTSMIYDLIGDLSDDLDSDALNDYDRAFLHKCRLSSLNEIEEQKSIRRICKLLKKVYKKDVLILVDEYDHCMQNIHSTEDYDAIVGCMQPFMEQTFKFNTDCEFAVVTGIMPLTKTSMLSSFNNASIRSILETEGDEHFGFTEEEVVQLLDRTGKPSEKISEIREWYDGYRFGNADVYNPFSVMMYLMNDCEPLAYWGNTTSGGMSKELLSNMGAEPLSSLKGLYENKGSSIRTELDTRISYSDILFPVVKPSVVYSYLAMSGYLKAVKTGSQSKGLPVCDVSMVNLEVSLAFEDLVKKSEEVEKIAARAMDSIYRKDPSELRENLKRMLNGLCMDRSWTELDPVSRHNRYRDVIMAYLMTPELTAKAEIPKGYGLTDIFFEGSKDRPPVIIEVKTTSDHHADLHSLANTALSQIDAKKYAEDPDSTGAICVGIGICHKKVEAVFAP